MKNNIFCLPYHSPYKFRHGNAVYAIKPAKEDIAALKAVNQNLMHKNLSITDGVYGILSETDVREQIALLGQFVTTQKYKDTDKLINVIKQLLERLSATVLKIVYAAMGMG